MKTSYLKRVRGGYRLIWRKARRYCSRLPSFPEPETFDPKNHHRGVAPSMPGDFSLTGTQASGILEKVADAKGTSYSQVRKVSATLSYLYQIQTGNKGNWPEVKKMLDSYDKEDFQNIGPSSKASVVPTPEKLKEAFTKPWSRASGWSLGKFCTGLLACWCWAVMGCRPRCDLGSLKTSDRHTVNSKDGWAYTEFDGGRNKLAGNKKRAWNGYFVCTCKNGIHRGPPVDFEWTLDKDGNPHGSPDFCTECPLSCIELKSRRKVDNSIDCFLQT